MNTKNKKIMLLSTVPIPKALLTMGIPTMIGMLVNSLYNLVDAYFVGGLGECQMGAISVAYPLSQIIVGLGLLFGNGAASYISRLLGQGDRATANATACTALFSSIFSGLIFIALSVILMQPLLKAFGATESIMPYALSYANIYIISCIFNIFNVTMNNIATAEGAAKTSMLALLAGALANIALDPLLINILHLGITGAAIATAISQLISTVIYLHYILTGKSLFLFSPRYFQPSKSIVSEIMKIGIPTFIFQVLTSISISLVNNAAGEYGNSAIAAMGIVTRLLAMGSLTVFGFIKGFQPIAGYSYGAGDFKRLQSAIRTAIKWSTVFCIIFGLFMIIFAPEIISLFTSGNTAVINIGSKSLQAHGMAFLLFGFHTVYSSLFLALGKAKAGLLLGACRQGICFIPVILCLPAICGLNGVLYAQPVADLLTIIITICMAIALHKELKKAATYK